MSATKSDITRLLDAWAQGRPEALDELIPLVFDDVRELARRYLAREPPGHTLEPTALVNEVYLRLTGLRTVHWANREQFFGFLSDLMRRILVDHARRHLAAKRGARPEKVSLDDIVGLGRVPPPEMVALDDALRDFAEIDPRKCRIVELRFFVGLTQEEIAELLGLSRNTVNRDWAAARLWLQRELSRHGADGSD